MTNRGSGGFFEVTAARETGTRDKGAALADAQKHGFAALFTFFVGHLRRGPHEQLAFFVDGVGGFALRVSGAGEKRSPTAEAFHEGLAAGIAVLVDHFRDD